MKNSIRVGGRKDISYLKTIIPNLVFFNYVILLLTWVSGLECYISGSVSSPSVWQRPATGELSRSEPIKYTFCRRITPHTDTTLQQVNDTSLIENLCYQNAFSSVTRLPYTKKPLYTAAKCTSFKAIPLLPRGLTANITAAVRNDRRLYWYRCDCIGAKQTTTFRVWVCVV